MLDNKVSCELCGEEVSQDELETCEICGSAYCFKCENIDSEYMCEHCSNDEEDDL